MTVCRLVGGPFSGQTRDLDPDRLLFTERLVVETIETDWGLENEAVVRVEKTVPVSYRRVDESTFEFCPTQRALGNRGAFEIEEEM